MPSTLTDRALARADAGDMFLKIKGAKHGDIKGESADKGGHGGEIEVISWSWGMQGRPSLGGGGASGKATIRELKITKRVDVATTALMSALRTNESIKEARLTVRKAGSNPALEYLVITIKEGRVTAVDIQGAEPGGGSSLLEHVSFSFNVIEVEYKGQGDDGQALGTTTFQDQFSQQS